MRRLSHRLAALAGTIEDPTGIFPNPNIDADRFYDPAAATSSSARPPVRAHRGVSVHADTQSSGGSLWKPVSAMPMTSAPF
jgi:hypothetical protein